MKDVRFYLEHDTPAKRRKGEHNGNVFAAFVADSRGRSGWEGLGAVHEYPNSPVAGTSCDAGYLRQCKRISEAKAREIHPRLFAALGESKPSRYKVAQPGGRWKRGFATLEDARAYASQVHQRTGVIAAVEVDV